MAKIVIAPDIHSPNMDKYKGEMLGNLFGWSVIHLLQKLGLGAKRAYGKVTFDIETVDGVLVIWQGDINE